MRANIVTADFKNNFRAATGAQDSALTEDLLLNEIASLIETKPLVLIQTMAKAGYRFKGETRGQLVKAVAQCMQKSQDFRNMLSVLIAVNNGIISTNEISQYANVVAQETFNDNGSAKKHYNVAGFVGDIIKGVSDITSSSLNFAASKEIAQGQKYTADKQLEITKKQGENAVDVAHEGTKQALLNTLGIKFQSGDGGVNMGKIFIGVAVVFILGFAGYFLWNRRKKTQTSMPAVTPPTQQAPVAPVNPKPEHGPEIPTSVAPPATS